MKNILTTKNLTKIYKSNTALDHVNLTIKKGEIYGLIGLNGAGKSTFMRAVTGLIYHQAGDISLFGLGGKELDKARTKIGQSIETPSLYENYTAPQNLEVQRRLYGNIKKEKIDEVLKIVSLENTGKKKVKNFSLGMKQRLAIAVALISNPEFLILDEPTNGLDPVGIIEIRNLMKKLATELNITILLSSHLLDELSKIATRFGIIHNGKMIKEFTQNELLEKAEKSGKNLEEYFLEIVGGQINE